jgi:SOS-response transcriptional repressor LexA
MAELTKVLGMRSTGGVFKTLNRLVDAGYLERVGTRYAPTDAFFALPLVGRVRAGLPQPVEPSPATDVLSVQDFLIDRPDQTVYCRVRGDSMRDAGLLDGDYVVVDRAARPKPGDIVVAVVDQEVTVKRLRSAGGSNAWLLEPANADYQVIKPIASLELLGVVVGSFRRFIR